MTTPTVLRFGPSGYHHYLVADLPMTAEERLAGVTRKLRIRNPMALTAQRDRDVTISRGAGHLIDTPQYACSCRGNAGCAHLKAALQYLGGPIAPNPCTTGPSDRSFA